VAERLDKPLAWLHGEIKTPPFSKEARIEAGVLARPMASIGKRCHELRVTDKEHEWRIVYRVDVDAIVIGDVFEKKTKKTPRNVIERCQRRLEAYDRAVREGKRR